MNTSISYVTAQELGLSGPDLHQYQLKIDRRLDALISAQITNSITDKKEWHTMIKLAMAELARDLPPQTNYSALSEYAWKLCDCDLTPKMNQDRPTLAAGVSKTPPPPRQALPHLQQVA